MLLQLFVEPKDKLSLLLMRLSEILGCLRTQNPPQYVYTKKASLIWLDPFMVQGIYLLQCKCLAKPLSIWSYMLRSYLYDVLNYLAGPQLHMNVAYYVTDS